MAAEYDNAVIGTPGLVAYHLLAEASGTTAADASGNGRTGTYAGTPTLGAAGPIAGSAATAATFDGVDDDVTLGDEPAFDFDGDDEWAVEAWVKPDVVRAGGAAEYVVFGKLSASSPFPGYELQIRWDGTSKTTLNVYRISDFFASDYSALRGSTDLMNGAYAHLLVRQTAAGVVAAFVNGAAETLSEASPGALSGSYLNAVASRIGSRAGSGVWFRGTVARVAAYSRALTAQEVASHYRAGVDLYLPATRRRLGGL